MTSPRRFRRRDTIEAVQWDGTEAHALEILVWLQSKGMPCRYERTSDSELEPRLLVDCRNVAPGNWIALHGLTATIHSPAVFAATWEEA